MAVSDSTGINCFFPGFKSFQIHIWRFNLKTSKCRQLMFDLTPGILDAGKRLAMSQLQWQVRKPILTFKQHRVSLTNLSSKTHKLQSRGGPKMSCKGTSKCDFKFFIKYYEATFPDALLIRQSYHWRAGVLPSPGNNEAPWSGSV
jgi:hypothetical protein